MVKKPWLLVKRAGWMACLAVPITACAVLFAGVGTTESEQKPTIIPRPAAPATNPVVAIAQGKDYAKTTLEAINEAGGLGHLIRTGSTVFIKVNIVNAGPSGTGKITDWHVAQAVVDECNRLGAAKVIVGEASNDGSGMGGFAAAGYDDLKGAELMLTNVGQDQCRLVTPEKSVLGQAMYIPKAYLDADVVIDIPVMKTHGSAGVTLGLKNVGIGIPPQKLYTTSRGGKWTLHDLGMNKVITEVSLIRRPDFTVIDGMIAGEGEGPNSPTPIERDLIIAGNDIVAVDTVGSMVMGINPEQITQLTYAAAQGIGITDPGHIRVVGKTIKSVRADFVRPTPYGHPYQRATVVRQIPSTITVDGSLQEWAGAWQNRIGDDSQFTGERTWKDLSARTMVMHDLKSIYFAYKVTDETLVQPKADGIELLLSFDMPFLEDTDENLKVRSERTSGKDFILTADYSEKSAVLVNQGTGKPVEGTQVTFAKVPGGYIAEGMVPLAALGRRPLWEREEIWMDFGVVDVDKRGQEPLRGLWNDGSLALQYDNPSLLGKAFVDPVTTSIASEVKAPMSSFVDAVNAASPGVGQVSLFWVGQSGYIVKGAGKTVYVDPYLSDSCGAETRIYPLPVAPDAVTNADIVLSSHPHQDHYDDQTIPPLMMASRQATLVLQERVKDMEAATLMPDALQRTKTIKVGQSLDFGAVKVTAVAAKHEKLVEDAGYENLGFILDFGGTVVYHAGDSLYWPGMAAAVRKGLGDRAIDVMLVPINGKWGNMNHKDAAKLASELKPALVIPMHYGTLSNNTVNPGLFVDYLKATYPDVAYRVMEPNAEFVYARK